jgi:glycine cleavage system H protein
VEEAHEALSDQLDLLSTEPFGEGWMIKIKMSNPGEVDSLLSAEAYEKIIAEAEA